MGTLFKFIGSVVLLVIASAVVAPMVIDPNDYREQIQTAVKEKTGRDLTIDGDLSLSVFPWFGVGIKDVSLSNAKGFKAKNFAEIKEASVKVKLLSLISQQLEVSTVVLNGVSINLAKNKSGISNWADMTQSSSDDAEETESEASSDAALGAVAIGGLQIVDANLIWDDASKGEKYSLLDLDLTTDALSLGSPMGISLAFTVDSSKPKATVRLKLGGDLVINSAMNKFDFQGMTLAIDAAGDPVPGGAMKVDIASHLIADLAGAGSLSLNPLTIKFDDSTLSGQASVNNFDKPAIQFDLAVDAINVDRYLPKQTASVANEGNASSSASVPPPAAVALIPVQMIRDLNIDGIFKVQSLIVNGLTAKDASVKVVAKNGVLKSEQAIKAFYNGSYAGETVVDARQNTPKIIVKEQATGINIEALLVDLMGESPISGVANIKADLTTSGNTIPAFKSALNGTAQFSFQDGAVTGIDVGALMKQADAVLKGDLSAAMIKGEGKTPFTDMSGSAQITNGLVANKDLLVASPLINVNGAGTANLVNEVLDYRLTLQRTKATSDAEVADTKDLKNVVIPVDVGGTFSEPKIQLDAKAIVLATQKEKIEEKKQELKQKLNDKIDEKFKGAAGELLKGLF